MADQNYSVDSVVESELAELDTDSGTVLIRFTQGSDIPAVRRLIHRAYAARPPIDPPASALAETESSIAEKLANGFGLVGVFENRIIASVLVTEAGKRGFIQRVCVDPDFQRLGLAEVLMEVTLEELMNRPLEYVKLEAHKAFPLVTAWWQKRGFVIEGEKPQTLVLAREIPIRVTVPTAADMQHLGRKLASVLRAGDVIIASGELGAGKTTLTQGIGAGLDVEGAVISPTFVLSRIHKAKGEGPDLVHVDAYRLGSAAELDDIDLDSSLANAVTLVEWGTGIAESLNNDRLEIEIIRGADDSREVIFTPLGLRWQGVLGDVLCR